MVFDFLKKLFLRIAQALPGGLTEDLLRCLVDRVTLRLELQNLIRGLIVGTLAVLVS